MDKSDIAIIAIVLLFIGGFLVYTKPWKEKGGLPSEPWEKNERITSRLRERMGEAGHMGTEIAVFENTSEDYPRTIRLYTRPVARPGEETEWNLYSTGTITRPPSVIDIETPWKEPEHNNNPVTVRVESTTFDSSVLSVIIDEEDKGHPPVEITLKSGWHDLTVQTLTKHRENLFSTKIDVPNLWASPYDTYGFVEFTVNLDEKTIDRQVGMPE